MYPLNVSLPSPLIGYAVANDEVEHQSLTDAGYVPALVVSDADPEEADAEGHTVETARAALDAAGVSYKRTFGLAKLLALIPA